jgi:hypothetical protein
MVKKITKHQIVLIKFCFVWTKAQCRLNAKAGLVSISSTLYLCVFLYECRFGSFFLRMYMRKKAAETTFVQKMPAFKVDEIDYRLHPRTLNF